MIRILLADDDDSLRRVISYKLKQRNYDVTAVENGLKALEKIQSASFDLVLSDMKMPGLSGIELLEKIKEIKPDLEVILITAHADIHQAVEAVKLGAFDYLPKPFEDEQLFVAIEKALKFKNLENENQRLKKQLSKKSKVFHIPGVSKAYNQLYDLVKKVAPSDATVLLTGASGTGKEIFAKLIHQESNRSEDDLISVNCAAIPKDLLESELFGHVRGAFTGAVKDKKGKFELADNGTLFLDEISELSTELQAKILRAIQERTIEPVGSEKKLEIDIRLIAATNKNLKELVANGSFREDLFYRLNVIPIDLPLLKERKEDIPILVNGFLNKYSKRELSIDPQLMKILIEYEWPGNIRELENLIERLVILRKSDTLTQEDLPDDFLKLTLSASSSPPLNRDDDQVSFHDAEKSLIEHALEKSGFNKSKASKLLQIPRHVLIYRMKKYNISNK